MQRTIATHTPETILEKVSDYFGIDPNRIFSKAIREENTVLIRQIYTYCLYRFTDMPQKQIAPIIKKHRSVVCSTVKGINARCTVDRDFRNQIIEIESLFE